MLGVPRFDAAADQPFGLLVRDGDRCAVPLRVVVDDATELLQGHVARLERELGREVEEFPNLLGAPPQGLSAPICRFAFRSYMSASAARSTSFMVTIVSASNSAHPILTEIPNPARTS